MKFIQTIIAFLSLYLFLGVIASFVVLAVWLTGFTPDISKQQVAEIAVTERDSNTGSGFTYFPKDSSNAFEVLVTRDVSSATSNNEPAVLAARSSVLMATYTKITLADFLVPLGFRSMYKLKSVNDASGRVIYKREDVLLDVFKSLGIISSDSSQNKFMYQEEMTLPIVASSTPITYTVTVDETGLYQEQKK